MRLSPQVCCYAISKNSNNQNYHNSVARALIKTSKSCHVTPIFLTLSWLAECIEYKLTLDGNCLYQWKCESFYNHPISVTSSLFRCPPENRRIPQDSAGYRVNALPVNRDDYRRGRYSALSLIQTVLVWGMHYRSVLMHCNWPSSRVAAVDWGLIHTSAWYIIAPCDIHFQGG